MNYPDEPGQIPVILASLRERALRTSPAPVDPGSGEPANPNPSPDPDPDPDAGTPAPRAAIGSNLAQQGVAILADLFKSGVTWQNVNASYAYTSAPANASASSDFYLNVPPPYADGEWHLARWREPGNTTGVSTWSRTYTNFDLNYSGTRFTDRTETYADGVFTARFRYFRRSVEGNPSGLIRWRGQGSIELLDFRPEALRPDAYFNPDIVAISSQRRGNIRALDLGGGNIWQQDWLWSERSRLDHEANKSSRQPSMPLELWRDLAILTNRDLEWIIPHKLPKSTIQAMVRAFMTGNGFDDGKPLPAHLNLYIELCDNEAWNYDLTGAAQDLQSIGYATGYVGSSGNYARLHAQEKRGRDVSAWIVEAVPTYMHRIVRIIGLSPANDMNDYISLIGSDKSYFDAVSKSIYMGIFAKGSYGGNTPAEIAPAWSADAKAQVDAFIKNLTKYQADGKRVLCYEIGSDTARVPWSKEQRATWLESPEFAAIYAREMLRAATATRDRLNLYWDFGTYRDDAAAGAWAHYQGPGKNNQKWTIANDVQSQLDAMVD